MNLTSLYIRLKDALPESARSMLSAINQRFFAEGTLRRKRGAWFRTDWRRIYKNLSDEEWIKAYNEAWTHDADDCLHPTEIELIRNSLGRAGTLLEVGSGNGNLAIDLARNGFSVTALDVSTVALDLAAWRAHEAGVSVNFVHGFAERLPFPDSSFDFVISCHTLEHVKDLRKACDEVRRVARERIVVLVPRQRFKTYMDNYHTQFFAEPEDLLHAFAMPNSTCRIITAHPANKEFQGEALLFVGDVGNG